MGAALGMDAAPPQIADGLVVGKGVAEWVCQQVGAPFDPNLSEGIGWARGGRIVMGVMFNGYNGANAYMHIARLRGEPMTPTFVAAIMDYPFVQLGLKRLTGVLVESNGPSRQFAEHLGATQEAVLQDAHPSGNLVIYRLLRKDAARWLTASYSRRLRKGGNDGRSVREG